MADGELELRIAWQRHLGRDHDRWFETVVNRYREPHRYYHNVRHVRWVVRHVGELSGRCAPSDVGTVIAAAFFHDVIYDPARPDNEAASAELAARALNEMSWAVARVAEVSTLICGTKHHDLAELATDLSVADHAVLYAADLAVLAADPGGYSDYVRNVRREYAHVSDDDWVTGRTGVLERFLQRPSIFAPMLGLDEWEKRARGNLTSELNGGLKH